MRRYAVVLTLSSLALAGVPSALAQSTGGGPASVPGTGLTQSVIPLTEQDRHVIREIVLKERPGEAPPRGVAFTLGSRVPERIATLPFPEIIRDKVPQLRPFTYLVKDDAVVVIDPKDNRVVDIIPDR